MRTFKLLIADPSVDFCRKLADALGDGPELRVCHDGQKARELLEQFRPDVLVMDLILPHQDGVCLLRAAQTLEKRPICVVATSLVNHYVETVIRSFDVDYLMQKPCDIPSLAERVFELTESGEAAIFVPPTAENDRQ